MTETLRAPIEAALTDAIARIEAIDPGDAFDPRVPEAVVAAGLHLLPVPTERGGLGATMTEVAQVLARLGAVDGSTALGFAMHAHVVGSVADSAGWSPEALDRLYAAVVDDGALVNAASTEEGGGSPARGAIPGTTATPDGGGGWRLQGEKTWTTWLPALRLALVSARLADVHAGTTEGAGTASESIAESEAPAVGYFLVDLETPGIERRPRFEALGMRGTASGSLVFDDVPVPAETLVVTRAAGAPDPRGAAPGAWFGSAVAATYLGVGEGARRDVARWALERRPGDGSSAVADIPSVQLRLGRADATLRAARIVVLDATRRWDKASDAPTRAALLSDFALAKVTATGAAVTATDEALRIAGGPGFLAGRIERAFRDARAGLINPPLEDVALTGFAKAVLDRERAS